MLVLSWGPISNKMNKITLNPHYRYVKKLYAFVEVPRR